MYFLCLREVRRIFTSIDSISMQLLYNFFVFLYTGIIGISAFLSPKAKLWINGRKDLLEKLKTELQHQKKIYWFHCASLGEFEQGRPLIEKIKLLDSEVKVLLTFFSPSGYEIRKNYSHADWVFYLPADTISNSQRFVEIVQPEKIFFVKYEFWFNYLKAIEKKSIPVYFISVNLRPEQYFFKWYGKWALNKLKKINHFFVQNEQSKLLLNKHGIVQVSIAGDTRFDRVIEIANENKSLPLIDVFSKNKKLIVAGSTYSFDDGILSKINPGKFNLIVAPHEISEHRLKQIESIFSGMNPIRYSKLQETNLHLASVIIIDNIGMLSLLYKYAYLNYIGGGFGKGIHNTLEAAVYGKPLVFGPNFQKFEEAKELIKMGAATSIQNAEDLTSIVSLLDDDTELYNTKSANAKNYVVSNAGAVNKIIAQINFTNYSL